MDGCTLHPPAQDSATEGCCYYIIIIVIVIVDIVIETIAAMQQQQPLLSWLSRMQKPRLGEKDEAIFVLIMQKNTGF